MGAELVAGPGLDVLVVDDEPSFPRVAQEVLIPAGHRVTTADSAEAALELLAAQRFDVAFVDLRLPKMGGADLMALIREKWPATEVVIVSAYASLESAIDAIRRSAFDYLLKPVDSLDAVTAIVSRVVDKRRVGQATDALVAELKRRNSEINRLMEWGHCLADSLAVVDVERTAVAGLSALASGRPVALLVTQGDALHCTAAHGLTTLATGTEQIPLPRDTRTTLQIANSVEVARAVGAAFGRPVQALLPLPLGGRELALLVLFADPSLPPPVSEESLQQFAAQVTTALGRAHAYERVSESTYKDALTGLYNQRYVRERLVDELARARRYTRPLGVLFMDIDHFKVINDTWGHLIGDQMLLTVAEIIRFQGERHHAGPANRASDVPVRYGGDEFMLLLPETALAGARVKAERIRTTMAAQTLVLPDAPQPVTATMSIGIAEFPTHGAEPQALIDAADKALYAAKHAGRNRTMLAGEG